MGKNTSIECYGGLRAAYVTIGRLKFGIGWVSEWWKKNDCWPIAFNRTCSWRLERKACLSLLWLRIGFQILPSNQLPA
jgi:hypothetical protein